MPLPTPNKNEREKDFMEKCMSSSKMNEEYGDPKQRAAVCHSQFKKRKSKAKWEDVEKEGYVFLK
tara:strand:+ start:167 stop:361 length:195 start_codon:yes stop_codon:yes gene_type:complete